MSAPQIPEPACLVISVLSPRPDTLSIITPALQNEFGTVEDIIGPLGFHYTDYYDAELGTGIVRNLLVFNELIDRNRLCEAKLITNNLENLHMINGARTFNLDPGLMTMGNFVLATGKNNAHRIYLDKGIFADLTLIFRRGSFRPLEWTYPDYSDENMLKILNDIREKYKCKLVASSQ